MASSPISPRDLALREKKFQSIEEIEAALNIMVRRLNEVYKYNRRDHDRLTEDVVEIVAETLTVEHHTANDVLTAAESGSVHTNYGASGTIIFTLPDNPPVGTHFWFSVCQGYTLHVDPSDTSLIFGAANGKKMMSGTAVGINAMLVSDVNGDWVVASMFGLWAIES